MRKNLMLMSIAGISGFILGCGVVGYAASNYVQVLLNEDVKITLNGEEQVFRDETTNEIQYPITYKDRTYLPLRTVATLVGVDVDYDSKTNTAILNKNDFEIKDTGEEIIKNLLITGGEWIPSVAYNGKEEVGVNYIYGNIIKHGGGITFKADGTFEKTAGAYEAGAEDRECYGKYTIDVNKKQITYIFNAGNISYGSYEEENGKIKAITFVEDTYLEEYVVKFIQKGSESVKYENLKDSLLSGIWLPKVAEKNGESIALSDVYGNNFKGGIGIEFDGLGEFYKELVTEEENEYRKYGFFFIDDEKKIINYQLVSNIDGSRLDIPCKYISENGEITAITFIENYGSENEIEVTFLKGNK